MILSALVGVLFVLVLIDLLLTTATLRRLGQLEQRIADDRFSTGGPLVGEPVPAFQAASQHGPITQELLQGTETLVAFLSSDCAPCRALAPSLAAYLPRAGSTGLAALIVIKHTPDQPTTLLEAFAGVAAPVVVEQPNAVGVASAFRPTASPSFFRVGADGAVVAKGIDLDAVLPRATVV